MSGRFKSNASAPPDTDIVKQGYLFIKRPPRSGLLRLKSWHKRYFVLRDETIDHPSRLEMYQKEADFCKNSPRRFVLNLDKVVHVGRTEDSKRFRQAFMIVCSGRTPVMLAEDDHLYTNSWLLAVTLIAEKRHYNNEGMDSFIRHFNRMPFSHEGRRTPSTEFHDFWDDASFNICYSDATLEDTSAKRYSVSVEPTKTAQCNGIEGSYDLIVQSWRLALVRPGKNDFVVQWPLCFIRKFKSENLPHSHKKNLSIVTLELGRRCTTGEGIIQLRTRFGKEIIDEMNRAIFQSMSHRSLMDSTSMCRALSHSRPSYQGHGSISNGIWKSMSRESTSSRGISLSRQSSGGASRSSQLIMDGTLQVVDLAGAFHGPGSPNSQCFQRSPLRSDSSGDSKALSDNIPRFRASDSSLLSSASSVSIHSIRSNVSNESAEYIQAVFPSPDSQCAASKDETKCPDNGTLIEENNKTSSSSDHGLLHNGHRSKADDRVAKAAAEGYLEVLPNVTPCGQETDTDSGDLSNIYHIMDFSHKTGSSSANHSRKCSSTSSSHSADNERKAGHGPKSPNPETIVDMTSDIPPPSRRVLGMPGFQNKPPAPLPRPVHTMQ